jgi:putative endonuclease
VKNSSASRKGREGEAAAARLLETRGYRIVERNVRMPGGEIDLVCVESGELVFVEVKRRDAPGFGSGLAGVDHRKRSGLRALAADYAQIVAPRAKITVHRNAF